MSDSDDAEQAFLKRQADAQFTVIGDAPEWAMRMKLPGMPEDDGQQHG